MKTIFRSLREQDSGLNKEEWRILKKLSTPEKIQDFLNTLPFNFELNGETYMSPQRALKARTAHCFEGALIAALALWMQGKRPLLLDLKSSGGDTDHVVTLFERDGFWGAISKTNHAVLRYREPVYKSVRELAMTYFHEYFLHNGKKTLRSFSKPFDLSKDASWITAQEDLFDLVELLNDSPHINIVSAKQIKNLRKAEDIERRAGMLVEWKKKER